MIAMLTTVLGLMSLILSNDATCHGTAMAFGLAADSIMTAGFVSALYVLYYQTS
jgi:hypothetical protein